MNMDFYNEVRGQRYQEMLTEASNERRLLGQTKKRTTRPEKVRGTVKRKQNSTPRISSR